MHCSVTVYFNTSTAEAEGDSSPLPVCAGHFSVFQQCRKNAAERQIVLPRVCTTLPSRLKLYYAYTLKVDLRRLSSGITATLCSFTHSIGGSQVGLLALFQTIKVDSTSYTLFLHFNHVDRGLRCKLFGPGGIGVPAFVGIVFVLTLICICPAFICYVCGSAVGLGSRVRGCCRYRSMSYKRHASAPRTSYTLESAEGHPSPSAPRLDNYEVSSSIRTKFSEKVKDARPDLLCAVIKLQAIWRGLDCRRELKRKTSLIVKDDSASLTVLRSLVLCREDELLAKWSESVSEEELFKFAKGKEYASWVVLMKWVGSWLLKSVACDPRSVQCNTSDRSRHAISQVRIIIFLLDSSITSRHLGLIGAQFSEKFIQYLLAQPYYLLLAEAIVRLLPNATIMPLLAHLAILPFSFQLYPFQRCQCISQLFENILCIPVLTYHLPVMCRTHFITHLPLSYLAPTLDPYLISKIIRELDMNRKRHIISNLFSVGRDRYGELSSLALEAYLALLTALMESVPMDFLSEPSYTLAPSTPTYRHSLSATSTTKANDDLTLVVLSSVPSPEHITSLLEVSSTCLPAVVEFFLSVISLWPLEKDRILTAVASYHGGQVVADVCAGWVRSGYLGRNNAIIVKEDRKYAIEWKSVVFLAETYTQAMAMMDDDDFFSFTASTTGTSDSPTSIFPKNPLTVDDLVLFSRRLLKIAFMLHWWESSAADEPVNVGGLKRYVWWGIRDSICACLRGVYARDSRKPFLPFDHWLLRNEIDLDSFVGTAIKGAQDLSERASKVRSFSLLFNIPFSIPFESRVNIFRGFVANEKKKSEDRRRGKTKRVSVRRGMIAQDAFDKLGEADLKASIKITFLDQFGQEEEGIDTGGLFKEFIAALCQDVFNTNRGLWLMNVKNELYPNPHAYATERHCLNWYKFIGRILGKILYEGMLVDVAFASFFLAKWLGKETCLDDLPSLDPELYQGFITLKHYAEDPENLSLDFTANTEDFGVIRTEDLIPNGSDFTVTRDNRLDYIHLMSRYRLSEQIKLQSEAFLEGLMDVIDPTWIRMFNQKELQILLGGYSAPLDMRDMRQYAVYEGNYHAADMTIEAFWTVVALFDEEKKCAFLRFVTSCSRPPLLGFRELRPPFTIRNAGDDQSRLPTASTCFNLLKLPRYSSAAILREKLLHAITSNAGFDLS